MGTKRKQAQLDYFYVTGYRLWDSFLSKPYKHCGAWNHDSEIKSSVLYWMSQPGAPSLFWIRILVCALVFYCYIINYHKFSDFKQYTFIIKQFFKLLSSCTVVAGFSAQGLKGQYQELDWVLISKALGKNLLPSTFWLLAEFSSMWL